MSSKPSIEDSSLPSYYDVVTNNEWQPNAHHLHNSIQTSVNDELLNLAIRLNSFQAQKHHQGQRDDERALDLLIPQIKAFLSEYSETNLPLATLILVPAGSINPGAIPADDDLRSPDDFGRVVTVEPPVPEKKLDLNADDVAVWNGEEMAVRLANYLSPKSEELPPRPAQSSPPPAEAVTTSKRSFFSRRKPTTETAVSSFATTSNVKTGELPNVVMVVNAEEVVFRVESELGLYESQTVWAIAVRIRVNGGKK